MNFHEFLQSIYMTTQKDLQKVYDVPKHALTQATEDLRNAQRFFYKIVAYITLPFRFIAMKLKLIPPPKSIEQHLADMKAEIETEVNNKIQTTKTSVAAEVASGEASIQHEIVLTDTEFEHLKSNKV